MSDSWKDQPRVPSGNPDGGQWTEAATAARDAAGLLPEWQVSWEDTDLSYGDWLEEMGFRLMETLPKDEREQGGTTEYHIAQALLDKNQNDAETEVFYDDDGRLMSAVSYIVSSDDKNLIVLNLGSFGEGFGRRAMEFVFGEALEYELGVALLATPSAVPFYERLGMVEDVNYSESMYISNRELRRIYGGR